MVAMVKCVGGVELVDRASAPSTRAGKPVARSTRILEG